MPELAGSAFGKVSLLGLATHTAGGFPLQVPDTVRDRAQLMAYLQAWQPSYAEGTRRTYANPSIGMLGVATANAMGQAYVPLMQGTLLPSWACPAPICRCRPTRWRATRRATTSATSRCA